MMVNSLVTTVVTPRKWVGRQAPSRVARQGAFDGDMGGVSVRVDRRRIRVENQVDIAFTGHHLIAFEIAWVTSEVLALAELGRVDENRQDQQITPYAPFPQQREMALVQIAHGWYERNRLPRYPSLQATALHLYDICDCFHKTRGA